MLHCVVRFLHSKTYPHCVQSLYLIQCPTDFSVTPFQCLTRVFAGMSDGLMVVYSLLDGLPVDGETYLCSHTINKTVFDLKDSDPRQRPYPIRSMALVSSGSQVSRAAPSVAAVSLRYGHVCHAHSSVAVSYGSLTVRECWSSTLWVSTPFGGWIPTTRRPPLYPWRATSVCREKRWCGCWMTTATRCSCTTLHPTNSVHSTGEWSSDVWERAEPRLGLPIWTQSIKTEIEVVHQHKK